MNDSEEKRVKHRYRVSIPAVMRTATGGVLATGLVENLSGSGALLTNSTGDLEPGTRGILRLMNLSQTLRTPSQDTMNLEAEVVRREMGGFAVRFLGPTRPLEALLERAMGRRAIVPTDDWP